MVRAAPLPSKPGEPAGDLLEVQLWLLLPSGSEGARGLNHSVCQLFRRSIRAQMRATSQSCEACHDMQATQRAILPPLWGDTWNCVTASSALHSRSSKISRALKKATQTTPQACRCGCYAGLKPSIQRSNKKLHSRPFLLTRPPGRKYAQPILLLVPPIIIGIQALQGFNSLDFDFKCTQPSA